MFPVDHTTTEHPFRNPESSATPLHFVMSRVRFEKSVKIRWMLDVDVEVSVSSTSCIYMQCSASVLHGSRAGIDPPQPLGPIFHASLMKHFVIHRNHCSSLVPRTFVLIRIDSFINFCVLDSNSTTDKHVD